MAKGVASSDYFHNTSMAGMQIKHDYVILTYISYKQISFVLLIGCFHCPCHAVHLDSHWLKEGKPVQPIYSNVSGKFDEPQ